MVRPSSGGPGVMLNRAGRRLAVGTPTRGGPRRTSTKSSSRNPASLPLGRVHQSAALASDVGARQRPRVSCPPLLKAAGGP